MGINISTFFASLLVSVAGSIIAHYLIKRLDRLSNRP